MLGPEGVGYLGGLFSNALSNLLFLCECYRITRHVRAVAFGDGRRVCGECRRPGVGGDCCEGLRVSIGDPI